MRKIFSGLIINEIIERFFKFWELFSNNHIPLVWLIAVFLPFIEAVLPFLPLVLIVSFNLKMINIIIHGPIATILAILLSSLGSFLGTYFIFLFIRGTFGRRVRIRIENNPKVLKTIKWLENRSDLFVILVLSNPYTPASIFNYAMAITNIETKRYLYITLVSRTICIILLALLGIIFDVQNDILAIVWVILVYIVIYGLFYIINKIKNKKNVQEEEK